MRIEGGRWRGRVLEAPSGAATRPTDGRTREMLFNSLGEWIVGARVLDLYAGSGAVGLEALSRGASHAVFIEQEHSALRRLRANIARLRADQEAQVWAANARSSIEKLTGDGQSFDLIFADPPFVLAREADEILARLDARPTLLREREGAPGLLVVQHSRRFELATAQHFELWRQKRAGESVLAFLRRRLAHPTHPAQSDEDSDKISVESLDSRDDLDGAGPIGE